MESVYDKPEEHGLKQIGCLDEADMSYEFNMLCVWQHKDGRIFYEQDSGCSCPSPFEDNTCLESLTEVKHGESFDAFVSTVNSFPAEASEKQGLIDAVKVLL